MVQWLVRPRVFPRQRDLRLRRRGFIVEIHKSVSLWCWNTLDLKNHCATCKWLDMLWTCIMELVSAFWLLFCHVTIYLGQTWCYSKSFNSSKRTWMSFCIASATDLRSIHCTSQGKPTLIVDPLCAQQLSLFFSADFNVITVSCKEWRSEGGASESCGEPMSL